MALRVYKEIKRSFENLLRVHLQKNKKNKAIYLCIINADNEMTWQGSSEAEAFRERSYLTCCCTLIWA